MLFCLRQRLLHVLYQPFSFTNRIYNSIVFWLRLLNELAQSRMALRSALMTMQCKHNSGITSQLGRCQGFLRS